MDTLLSGKSQSIPVTMRFQVEPGDSFCLPPINQLCVEQGALRITRNGKHNIVHSGESLTASSLSSDAMLTVLGKSTAVIEVILPRPESVMLIFDMLMEVRARQQAAARNKMRPHKTQHMCRTA